ncbi:hypothetical protein EFO71_12895 [Lacticaseibacillus rhamnosus]|nr:hypothetical protein [Lacticaseibacillus rhamnosus]MCT3179661.1 hypothetical protein [Lacticaseibacillus rhamnosus]MCT3185079.1 hypothetical protein [Lacticaseibacillus rhamnosus]MCT4450167.1 hypothetical protein [Lacticaseibacillus rhamnosus]
MALDVMAGLWPLRPRSLHAGFWPCERVMVSVNRLPPNAGNAEPLLSPSQCHIHWPSQLNPYPECCRLVE